MIRHKAFFLILLGFAYMNSFAMEEESRIERIKNNYCRSTATVFKYTTGFSIAAACTVTGIATDTIAPLCMSFAIGYTLVYNLQKERQSYRFSLEQERNFKQKLLLRAL